MACLQPHRLQLDSSALRQSTRPHPHHRWGCREFRLPKIATDRDLGCLKGDVEGQCLFQRERPPWTAFRTTEYGFGRLTIRNSTHLDWEQTSVERGGSVIDRFTIVKDRHGAYDRDARGHYVSEDYEGPLLKAWRALSPEEKRRDCHMPGAEGSKQDRHGEGLVSSFHPSIVSQAWELLCSREQPLLLPIRRPTSNLSL